MARQDTIGQHRTTISVDDAGFICVTYHATTVFKLKRDGNHAEVVLNSGGWRTNTTKTRINQACAVYGLPFYVKQEAFNWFLQFTDGSTREFIDGDAVQVVLK